MKSILVLIHISVIFSEIIIKTIDESTRKVTLECELNENNTMFWIKDGKDMSFDSSYMSFDITKRNDSLISVLTLSDLIGKRDQGVYICNTIVYQLVNKFQTDVDYTTNATQVDSQDEYRYFFKVLLESFEDSFRTMANIVLNWVQFYWNLPFILRIGIGLVLLLLIFFFILIKVIAITYKRCAESYAKTKFLLEPKYGQLSDNILLTAVHEEEVVDHLVENIADYSFVSLLND